MIISTDVEKNWQNYTPLHDLRQTKKKKILASLKIGRNFLSDKGHHEKSFANSVQKWNIKHCPHKDRHKESKSSLLFIIILTF